MTAPDDRHAAWRERLHQIIFEADTPAGRTFDVTLLVAIVLSVLAVVLDSVGYIQASYGPVLRAAEWFFTVLFTVEYLVRLAVVHRPLRYMVSLYGLVDLIAIVPTWLALFVPGAQTLLVIRALRLLRVFRVLKMAGYLREARVLGAAVAASGRKIAVFLGAVLTIVVIVGSLMYVVEGPENGFVNIPESMYWAIVTLSTVGYGDIAPNTPLGKLLASFVMALGYGIIAVPTGIVTVELANAARATVVTTQACPACGRDGHDPDARHCKFCGAKL
ncbi:MAG: ion transporter [Myxococcota bacterium]